MTTHYFADWRNVPKTLWRWANFSPEEIACRGDGTIRIDQVSSERVVGVCPPVLEYDAGVQARAAEEVLLLPDGSIAVELLSDYAVMREQARVCDFP